MFWIYLYDRIYIGDNAKPGEYKSQADHVHFIILCVFGFGAPIIYFARGYFRQQQGAPVVDRIATLARDESLASRLYAVADKDSSQKGSIRPGSMRPASHASQGSRSGRYGCDEQRRARVPCEACESPRNRSNDNSLSLDPFRANCEKDIRAEQPLFSQWSQSASKT